MNVKALLRRKLLPATLGASAIALAAGGVAYAATPSPVPAKTSASPASSATASPAGAASTASLNMPAGLRADVVWLARHTIHAQLVVDRAGTFHSIEVDRGRLTSVSSSQITIERPDNVSVSATLDGGTHYVGLTQSQLAPGDGVILVQSSSSDALYVLSRTPRASSSSKS